jgi:hypothetical protein
MKKKVHMRVAEDDIDRPTRSIHFKYLNRKRKLSNKRRNTIQRRDKNEKNRKFSS